MCNSELKLKKSKIKSEIKEEIKSLEYYTNYSNLITPIHKTEKNKLYWVLGYFNAGLMRIIDRLDEI